MYTAIALMATSITAALVLTGCASSSDSSGDDAAATANVAAAAPACASPTPAPPTGEEAVAQPNDQGAALYDAICAATTSIDIVIYQIGSPDLQNALIAAMQRGVKVRVMMDGYTANQVKYNGEFATSITQAAQQAGVPAQALAVNWSSDNFNITHQKSVIIDGVDASGTPLAAGSLPPSARLLVSTGNFQDYQGNPFYAARDFYVTTGEQALIAEAAKVFASDFSCAGPTVTNGLQSSQDLVWSNGTTGLYVNEVGQYPPVDIGYFSDTEQRATDPAPVDQGNSFNYQYDLVKNAGSGDVVRIYNEEFTSTPFVNAVIAAAQKGADVRIVMSYEGSSSSMKNLSKMAAAVPADSPLPGVTVTLYAPQGVVREALYIHAKAIMVNGADGAFKGGFVGSENLSNASMGYNRELGLPLTSADTQVISTIEQTFDGDFNSKTNTAQWNKSNPTAVPASWNKSSAPVESERDTADGSPNAHERLGSPVGRCGPVSTS